MGCYNPLIITGHSQPFLGTSFVNHQLQCVFYLNTTMDIETTKNNFFDLLPNDLLIIILAMMGPFYIKDSIIFVCKRWKKVVLHICDSHWEKIARRNWKTILHGISKEVCSGNSIRNLDFVRGELRLSWLNMAFWLDEKHKRSELKKSFTVFYGIVIFFIDKAVLYLGKSHIPDQSGSGVLLTMWDRTTYVGGTITTYVDHTTNRRRWGMGKTFFWGIPGLSHNGEYNIEFWGEGTITHPDGTKRSSNFESGNPTSDVRSNTVKEAIRLGVCSGKEYMYFQKGSYSYGFCCESCSLNCLGLPKTSLSWVSSYTPCGCRVCKGQDKSISSPVKKQKQQ